LNDFQVVDEDEAYEWAIQESLKQSGTSSSSPIPFPSSLSSSPSSASSNYHPNSSAILPLPTHATQPQAVTGPNDADDGSSAYEFGGSNEKKDSFLALDSRQFRTDLLNDQSVGQVKLSAKSLAWGLFFNLRAVQFQYRSPKVAAFRTRMAQVPCLTDFDARDDHLHRLRDQWPTIRRFASTDQWSEVVASADVVYALWGGLTEDLPEAGRCQLVLALELKEVHKLKCLRKFSELNGPDLPKLPLVDWQYLLAKVITSPPPTAHPAFHNSSSNSSVNSSSLPRPFTGSSNGTTNSNDPSPTCGSEMLQCLLRLIAVHGPKEVASRAREMTALSSAMQPELLALPQEPTHVRFQIARVDLCNVDKPAFEGGHYRYSPAYKCYVRTLSSQVLSLDPPPTSFRVDVHAVDRHTGNLDAQIQFTDAGGPTRTFLTSLGALFEQHHAILEDGGTANRVVLNPNCTPDVYSFLAYAIGTMARYNYANQGSTIAQCSIRWFLTPALAEFLFDGDEDRLPTIGEIHAFFPNIERDFAMYKESPEDAAGVYDPSQRVFFHESEGDALQGNELTASNERELRALKDKYIEHVQTYRLLQGHQAFYRTLRRFFTNGLPDYETIELLIVGHELTADEVINVFQLDAACHRYSVRDDRIPNTVGRMLALSQAFPLMVREMTPVERENLLMFAMGSVPTVLKANSLKVESSGHAANATSWMAGSCSGYIVPPLNNPHNPLTYTTLLEALRTQSALDRGSTGGQES
jgi:hypothetical protein